MSEVQLEQGTIRYRDTGGDGPVVVLVHGAFTDGRLWNRVVERLAPAHRCVVPDLPLGAHAVPLPPSPEPTLAGVARLLADFMEALDLRDVTLVGNDTGGVLCQLVATRHAERVARLVLTPTDAFDNFLPRLFRPLQIAARVPGGLKAFVMPLKLRPPRRLPIAFGWLAKRPDLELEDAWVEAFFANRAVRRDVEALLRDVDPAITRETAQALTGFDRPALIAWAADDKVFPFEHAERLAASMPDARVERIEDARTFVMLDQPERTAGLIAAFVGETAQTGVRA